MSATLTENKLLARRYFEHILNAGNSSVADTLLASDFIFRNPPIVAHGVSEFKAVIASVRGAFPMTRGPVARSCGAICPRSLRERHLISISVSSRREPLTSRCRAAVIDS